MNTKDGQLVTKGYLPCENCCEHGDVDGCDRMCLDCGKDMTESMAAAAYDRYKSMRFDE